jgi:DNA polymerase-3 subunit delta'
MPFSSIAGQDRITALLRRSLETGRISHAYLFEGIDAGCLKETALALVQAVFCGATDGCGDCDACRRVQGQNHPDLHLLQSDGAFIKVDQVRELQRELALRPYQARKKACIIEDADRMNPASGNAFLKTLEEPPGDALLILLTTHGEGILPTIRSRCQILRFPPLSTETVASLLRENGTDEEQARMAAALAGGSLSRAREIAGADRLQMRRTLLERTARLSCREISTLLETAEDYARDRETATDAVDMLKLFWRDILLFRAGSGEIANLDLQPLVKELSERMSTEQILEKLERIAVTGQALARNVNPRLALEVLFMDLEASGQV